VDFTHQLTCPHNLEVAVLAHEGDRLRSAPLWLLPATLSLVVLKNDRGVAFTPIGDPAAVFELPYPTTLVVGILPLIASPLLVAGASSEWSLTSNGRADADFRSYLLSNAERLGAFAGDPPANACQGP
jgi:hypothetical protein